MNEETAATVNETAETKPRPRLWNPNAATNWSVLFTPIFGAWLQAKNWEALGDGEQAKKSMYWVYGGFAFLVLCLFLRDELGLFLRDELGYLPGIIFLLAWYFTTAKRQIKHVKDVLKNDYERKSWTAPMKFAAIGLLVFFIIAWISSHGVKSILEKESVALVTQIIDENRNEMLKRGVEPAKCLRVIIDEKIDDKHYKATATLDNGMDVKILITHEGDQVGVTLNLYQ